MASVPAPTGLEARHTSRFVVPADRAGERLDSFLAAAVEGSLSRTRIQTIIAEGGVTVNDVVITQSRRRLGADEVVSLAPPPPDDPIPKGEPIDLVIRFEDDELVVVDKPAGLVVHPGPGNWTGTLVNALIHHCGESLSGIGGVRRPGIVHRLDKDTSGLIVVAKSDHAHAFLADQFAAHGKDGRLSRSYRAAVWGTLSPAQGLIDAALGRSATDRTKRSVVPAGRGDARHAVTHYEVVAVSSLLEANASLVECRLETGRTHQIRVHLASIGHPLIGDPVYGSAFQTKVRRLPDAVQPVVRAFGRQALHAYQLGFVHPRTGQRLDFVSSLPDDMLQLCAALDINVGTHVATAS